MTTNTFTLDLGGGSGGGGGGGGGMGVRTLDLRVVAIIRRGMVNVFLQPRGKSSN